jgi:hypothetical protein
MKERLGASLNKERFYEEKGLYAAMVDADGF